MLVCEWGVIEVVSMLMRVRDAYCYPFIESAKLLSTTNLSHLLGAVRGSPSRGTLHECSRERSLQTCGSSLFNKLRLKAEEGKINLVFVPPALQKSVSIQQILVDDADAG